MPKIWVYLNYCARLAICAIASLKAAGFASKGEISLKRIPGFGKFGTPGR